MIMAKHTPGPWSIFLTKGEPPFYVIGIGRPDGEGITDGNVGLGIWGADSPEALANARLIAAAPELLAALTRLLEGVGVAFCNGGIPARGGPDTLAGIMRVAKAAIAKAEAA